MKTLTWVVGAGGLLGSAVSRAVTAGGGDLLVADPIPWNRPEDAQPALRRGITRLLDRAERTGARWQLAWCAGAGVTGTSDAELEAEVDALAALLGAVRARVGPGGVDPASGAVFVASSVGGVYAGATGAPFTELHEPAPTSAYGRAKLAGEQVAQDFAATSGVAVVIGRITNLYGPGQDLSKPQGLISHLCRAHLTRTPISIYVSLDTIRDYLYVDDCADLILDALAGAADVTTTDQPSVVKLIGSHQGVTIGTLLGEFRRVFKRSPWVLLGTSATARYQAGDLRIRSVVWPALDRRPLTSLPAGMAATAEDLFRMVKGAG